MKIRQNNIFLIFFLFVLSSCSNPYSKENLRDIIIKYNNIDADIWKVSEIEVNNKTQLNLYQNNNCFNIDLSFRLNQIKECYVIKNDSLLEKNYYIKKIKKALELPLNKVNEYDQDFCVSKISLDNELKNILNNERKNIGKDVCVKRNHAILGNECIEFKKYDNNMFLEKEKNIVSNYNKELNALKRLSNKSYIKKQSINICEKDGNLDLFNY